MKSTTQNRILFLENTSIGASGVVSISTINLPSIILLGIIILSLLGILITVIS